MFIQQSNEYIQQIEAEIERLQHLREQVLLIVHSEEQLDTNEPAHKAVRKRAVKKTTGIKSAVKTVPAKKRGRPNATEVKAKA